MPCVQIDDESKEVKQQHRDAEQRLHEIQGIKAGHSKEVRRAKTKLTSIEAKIAKCDTHLRVQGLSTAAPWCLMHGIDSQTLLGPVPSLGFGRLAKLLHGRYTR